MIWYDEFWYETGMEDFGKWMLIPELKTNVREINTLEEAMRMYRDSIAYRMMESIRKDCEEE